MAKPGSNVIDKSVLNSRDRQGNPGIDDNHLTSALLRLTYQMNQGNKLSVMFDKVRKRRSHAHDADTDVDTASESWTSPHYDTGTAKWTSLMSNRVLTELGFSLSYEDWYTGYQNGIFREIPGGVDGRFYCASTPCFPDEMTAAQFQAQLDQDGWYGVVEHNDDYLGLAYEASDRPASTYPHRLSLVGSTSYVTGSHNVKVGFTNTWGNIRKSRSGNGNLSQYYSGEPGPFGIVLAFVNADHFAAAENNERGLAPGTIGTPDGVEVYNHPSFTEGVLDYNGGFYAQDSWTIDKLTVNYGGRVDFAKASVPAIGTVQGRFSRGQNFPAVDDLPTFGPDISPRLSLAYDVFGNNKTAVKAGFGRYPRVVGADGYGEQFALNREDSDAREWSDLHLLPDGSGPSGLDPFGTNGDDIAQDWEIGVLDDTSFGLRNPSTPDPDLKRQYSDQYWLGLQQEITSGVSLEVNWRHGRQYNTQVTDSDYRSRADFGGSLGGAGTALIVPRPFPYTGSVEIFNLSAEAGARVGNDIVRNRFDGYTAAYTALEVSSHARLRGGGTIFGGWTIEKDYVDDCQDILDQGDDPNALRFCDGSAYPRPWRNEFKLSGSYPVDVPGIGTIQFAGSLRSTYTDKQFSGNNLREVFRISRSSRGSNQTEYRAPWYSGDIGGTRIVDRNAHPWLSIRRNSHDIVNIPRETVKFMPYWNQVDVNVAKVFNIGSWRYDARVEVFNALNCGVVYDHVSETHRGTTAGFQISSQYERARGMLDGRVIRLAVTARF